MKKWLIDVATGRPRLIYALVVVAVVLFASLLTRIQIDTDPENMLPPDQADRVFHNEVEERFTLHDAIVIGIVNDDASERHLQRGIAGRAARPERSPSSQLDGVIAPDLMSLAVTDNIDQEGPGTIRFEWMMREAPTTAKQALEIRDKVARLPLLQDTLVSGDGKAAAIYVPIASKDLSYPLSHRDPGTDRRARHR